MDSNDTFRPDPLWTQEAWKSWDDYLDQMSVEVRFVEAPWDEEPVENWHIQIPEPSNLSRDWLIRNLLELGRLEGQGCGGHGHYLLNTRSNKTEWGASGATFDIILTLGEAVATAAAWDAIKWICGEIVKKSGDTEAVPLPDEGQADRARESAKYRVQVTRDQGTPADLEIMSERRAEGEGFVFQIQDPDGVVYEVQVAMANNAVTLSRLRSITKAGPMHPIRQDQGKP